MTGNSLPSKGRREFLKTTSAGAAGLAALPALGRAKQSASEVYLKSLRLRDKAGWSDQKWRKYLRRKGFETDQKAFSATRRSPTQSSGDVSTQKFEKHHLNYSATVSHQDGDDQYFAHFAFDVDDGWWRDGEYPDDGIGFGWDSDEFDFDNTWNGNGLATPNTDDIEIAQYSGRGVALSFGDSGDAKEDNRTTVAMRNEGGSEGTRNVFFSYMHTWNSVEVEKMTIGTDGVISVTLSDSTKQWDNPAQAQVFV